MKGDGDGDGDTLMDKRRVAALLFTSFVAVYICYLCCRTISTKTVNDGLFRR